MKCPVCKTYDLMMTDKQGVEIDYCPNCRGVWLDRGELEKLIERSMAYEQQWQQPRTPQQQSTPQQPSQPVVPPSSAPYPPGQTGYPPQQPYYYDDDDDYYRQNPHHPHGKKRKGFLGEVFDIFD